MAPRRPAPLAAALLALLLGGCGTILSLSPHEGGLSPYSGVRTDIELIPDVMPLLVLDLPLSAVLDTLLLPISIPLWLSADDYHDPYQERPGTMTGSVEAAPVTTNTTATDPLAPR
jgi:uncharacterized protein YceK